LPIQIEANKPDAEDTNVFLVEPGIHRPEDVIRAAEKPSSKDDTIPDIIYFRAGLHYIEQTNFLMFVMTYHCH
jgi:hypothetical protein